jgi:MFS family permease
VWLLEAGGLANMFGVGVVIPFLIIYLHDVRGLSLTAAGIAASANALASLPSGIFGGALVDRFGAKRTAVVALLVQALAISCFPLIRDPWHAVALQIVMGAGNGTFWPAHSSILTNLTPDARRHGAFALQRAAMNLGIGLGSVAGGMIANVSDPRTFSVLFAIDAVTFAGFAVVLARMETPASAAGDAANGRYMEVLRDWPFLAFVALNVLYIGAGIVPFVEFLPVYAKNGAGVSERAIGWIFFANTMCIVLAQLPLAKVLEGRRRMPALALMAAGWGAMWLVVPATVETLDATTAAWVLAGVAALLGLGECLHGPIQAPMVADLAPPALLGRYMALASSSWHLGFVVGAAAGGFLLDVRPVALWMVMAAVCALAAVLSLALERAIPARHRRTPLGTSGAGERPIVMPVVGS